MVGEKEEEKWKKNGADVGNQCIRASGTQYRDSRFKFGEMPWTALYIQELITAEKSIMILATYPADIWVSP
jgi:hypothetical protein